MIGILPRLKRFARALSGCAHEAEDLVQTAVERALRHEHEWQDTDGLDRWMFRVVENLWRDELRSSRRRRYGGEVDETFVGSDGRSSETRLELAGVHAAMARLPVDQRAVLALVCLDGMSYRAAAEALDIPIGTVMSRLARARASLATELLSLKTGEKA